MLSLKKKKLIKSKSKAFVNKKKTHKLRFSRKLTESLLINQLNTQKKRKFNLPITPTLNSQKRTELVSRVKKKTSVNLSAKVKSGIARMSFKQVEQKFIGHIMQRGLRAKALTI
jgi:hypothetical protein